MNSSNKIDMPEKDAYNQISDELKGNARESKSSFVVQIQFVQNATWQGSITWLDKQKTQRFRSTLEMLKLMDEAVGTANVEQTEGEGSAEW